MLAALIVQTINQIKQSRTLIKMKNKTFVFISCLMSVYISDCYINKPEICEVQYDEQRGWMNCDVVMLRPPTEAIKLDRYFFKSSSKWMKEDRIEIQLFLSFLHIRYHERFFFSSSEEMTKKHGMLKFLKRHPKKDNIPGKKS